MCNDNLCYSLLCPPFLLVWGYLNDMRFVEVHYDEYAITQTTAYKGSDMTVVNKLHGKDVTIDI